MSQLVWKLDRLQMLLKHVVCPVVEKAMYSFEELHPVSFAYGAT